MPNPCHYQVYDRFMLGPLGFNFSQHGPTTRPSRRKDCRASIYAFGSRLALQCRGLYPAAWLLGPASAFRVQRHIGAAKDSVSKFSVTWVLHNSVTRVRLNSFLRARCHPTWPSICLLDSCFRMTNSAEVSQEKLEGRDRCFATPPSICVQGPGFNMTNSSSCSVPNTPIEA